MVIVSGVALLVTGLVSGRLSVPSYEQVAQIPWWAWFGGVLGTVLTLSQLFIVSKLGVAPFLGTLVTVGVLASIILDHYGWVRFEVHHASIWRVLGGVLMVAGVALVALFRGFRARDQAAPALRSAPPTSSSVGSSQRLWMSVAATAP